MLIEKFKLENWIDERENLAKYNLSETCIKALTLRELGEICNCDFKELYDLKLNYGQIWGSANLKQAICNLYENQKSENITVTLGGIGANNLALETLVEKGGKVVCILPCYQQSYSLPRFYGANVELFFLNKEDWSLDKEKFKEVVGNDTKLICLTTPNNPTGMNFSDDEVEFIINTARNCGAYIFADEAYRGLNHFGNSYSKSFADMYEKGVATGSMSKSYSLAGIRLGWIVANADIIDKINLNREYNTISISALDDYVATVALNNHEKIVERNLAIVKEGKQIVKDFIAKEQVFSWVEPNSATICCVKYDLDVNSFDFCDKMLKDTSVLTVPASAFEYENFFRLGYAMGKDYLQEALNIMSEWVRRTY